MNAPQTAPLSPKEAVGILRSTSTFLDTLLRALPAQALTWRFDPKEWCVNEILGHFIETERRAFAGRTRLMLTESEPALVPFDETQVALERNDAARDGMELLNEFLSLRSASAEMVASLKDAELGRAGLHPEAGRLEVRDVLHQWVRHDQDHLRQMLDIVQRYVWGNLGGAQKFYEEE